MAPSESTLKAFRISEKTSTLSLRRAESERVWMKATLRSFANRCLPMRIASQAGWWIITEKQVRVRWSGQTDRGALTIDQESGGPAISHFGHGIVTFPIPFLFRTLAGTALLLRGPANMPKDGACALEAIVETDWSVAGMSLNWQLTRAGEIRFDAGEPIGMLVPQNLTVLESIRPQIAPLADEPELQEKYAFWRTSNQRFTEKLEHREPEAVKLGWQRNYFRGLRPDQYSGEEAALGHRAELKLADFTDVNGNLRVQG